MARFEQELLRPGRYHLGGDRYRTFTVRELRDCMENTRELMMLGYRIPVLSRHATPGSVHGGPRTSSDDNHRASHRGIPVGHLVELSQTADGALRHVIDVSDERCSRRIAERETANTSPELRDRFFSRDGRTLGLVIAHVALTRRPRFVNQAPLEPLGQAVQFSLDDLIPEPGLQPMSDHHPHKETPDADSAAAAVQGDRVEQPAPHSPEPDGDFAAHVEPTDEGAQLQLAAELQHLLKERGFEVGAASELGGVPQQVLAAIVQALGATRVSNANSRGDDESSGGAQDDLGETNPSNEDLQRSVYRQALTDRIARSRKLPKGLRGRLAEAAEAVQLSQDGDEEPSLRLSDAVTLIEDTLPDHIALSADGARQTDHPSGEGFFTGDTTQMSDEEAERIAQEQLKNSGFLARRPDH